MDLPHDVSHLELQGWGSFCFPRYHKQTTANDVRARLRLRLDIKLYILEYHWN